MWRCTCTSPIIYSLTLNVLWRFWTSRKCYSKARSLNGIKSNILVVKMPKFWRKFYLVFQYWHVLFLPSLTLSIETCSHTAITRAQPSMLLLLRTHNVWVNLQMKIWHVNILSSLNRYVWIRIRLLNSTFCFRQCRRLNNQNLVFCVIIIIELTLVQLCCDPYTTAADSVVNVTIGYHCKIVFDLYFCRCTIGLADIWAAIAICWQPLV